MEKRRPIKDGFAEIQVKQDGALDNLSSHEGAKKWSTSMHVP